MDPSSSIDSFAEGWSWFMARRQDHPAMRKMGPYLAAEWWQRVEKEPLWPGRTDLYVTGIEVDDRGLVAVTILLDDPEAWKRLAPFLGPDGSAQSPTDLTPKGVVPLPPTAPRETARARTSQTQPAPTPLPTMPRRRTVDAPMTVIPVPQDTSVKPELESVDPPPAPVWTAYARIPLRSIGKLALDPHVIAILDPGQP
jgi:hypothetical protein